jgi:hypothetical protein
LRWGSSGPLLTHAIEQLVIAAAVLFEEQAEAVTARKDDAPTAYQAPTTNLAGLMPISGGGGLIQTTSG